MVKMMNIFVISCSHAYLLIPVILHSCGCASTESPHPGQEMTAKAIYERAIHLNVTAKVSYFIRDCYIWFNSV